ncbi:hypothetical protein PUNSTDRAFT_125102 [Punctularia strigosozonata HHB-11173 SS5]|uniref:uncharacterized protein n=1 Tax=Punctularia strigosozonata (strain HHB-11173) TaxID=741275 RepID=UPI0004417B2C|nr:uncharacterized protein PUNSTDRAFT_125102 [Punctularia strigosozonata HHB-11173 SS5]EIN12051.1 hypothetical protein PUNSTDRAFT_125102 [Punctularia strigosozonata HHB-11173 SS5]
MDTDVYTGAAEPAYGGTPPPDLRSPSPLPPPLPSVSMTHLDHNRVPQSYVPPPTSPAYVSRSNTHLLSVYINDMRSRDEDPQFAEFPLPLRTSPDGHSWTVDAQHLCDALQNSVSRIDGPAKVYVKHEQKYKKYFLRVSANHEDETSPMSLEVRPDKSIEICVESGPANAPVKRLSDRNAARTFQSSSVNYQHKTSRSNTVAPTALSPIVPQKRGYSPEPPPSGPSYGHYDSRSPPFYGTKGSAKSPTFPRHDSPMDWDAGTPAEPYPKRTRHDYSSPRPSSSTRHSDRIDSAPPTTPTPNYYRERTESVPPTTPHRRYYRDKYGRPLEDPPPRSESPAGPAPVPATRAATREEVDRIIAEHIRLSIEEDPEWLEWYPSVAKPQSVPVVLKRYRYAKKKIDFHMDLVTPDDLQGAPKERIRPEHVVQALGVPAEEVNKWTRNCLDTLRLLDLYGEKGTRLRDAQVIRMAQEEYMPGQPEHSRPIKRLLKYLKDLDDRWTTDHPEDAPSRTGKRKEKKSKVDYGTSAFRMN